MRKYLLNPFLADYERRLATILGENWRTRAKLDKKLSPYKGLELYYYRVPDESYFRLITGAGLHVLAVYESELAFEVASCPINYKADFREQFEYAPDEDELLEQIKVLLDFWRTGLNLDLSKPLVFRRPSLGDKVEVEYGGYEFYRDRAGRLRLQIRMIEIDFNSPFTLDLIMFTPEWSDVIPRQCPVKQLSLFG